MPKPLSMDLRIRVAKRCQCPGQTVDEIADLFAIGTATVKRIKAAARKGDLSPKPHAGGQRRKLSREDEEVVRQLLATQNDAILREWVGRIKRELGIVLSVPTMSRTLARMGITRKKRRCAPPSVTPNVSKTSERTTA